MNGHSLQAALVCAPALRAAFGAGILQAVKRRVMGPLWGCHERLLLCWLTMGHRSE